MIIRLSSRTGPIHYELAGEPRLIDGDDGIEYYEFTLRNARLDSQRATLMLTRDEMDQIGAAGKRRKR